MKINDEKIEFKIFDALKLPQDHMECFNVCMVQDVVEEVFQVQSTDPMDATLTHSLTKADIESEVEEVTEDITKSVHLLEVSPKYPSRYTPPFETLIPTNTTLVPSIVQAPNLELKLMQTKGLDMLIIHVGMELNLHKTLCHFLVAQLQDLEPNVSRKH
jgi:hypothetical protein